MIVSNCCYGNMFYENPVAHHKDIIVYINVIDIRETKESTTD